jgi:modulator of drug activity B
MTKKCYILLAAKPFAPGGAPKVSATGELNKALAQKALEVLSPHFDVTLTNIAEGYDYLEERQKLLSHDLVIMQFPVYWFSTPHYLKHYMDDVYISHEFWHSSNHFLDYGRCGRLKANYMLSVTFNSPQGAFLASGVANGRSPDDLLASVHLTQQYIGMQPLPTFAATNVYDIYDKDTEASVDPIQTYEQHLRKYILAG